ncbi:MAG: hypothetical protein EZS28_018918, partial [Streblomastix strix]
IVAAQRQIVQQRYRIMYQSFRAQAIDLQLLLILHKFIERNGMKFCEGLADKKITNIRPKWIPANTYDELLFERLTKVLNTETKLN